MTLAAVAGVSGVFASTAYAEEVEVKRGDTLWGISQTYNVSVNNLKEWNNLSSTIIYPGSQLEVSAPGQTTEKVNRVDSNDDSTNTNTSHTVKSGDSLWAIGNQYGVSVSQLKSWNNLSTNTIYVGQKLVLSASKQVQSNESNVQSKETSNVAKTLQVKATAYTANCAGCSGITSTGINLKANPNKKVISVDPNVIPLGSKVHVEGYGYAVAGDVGGGINGNEIDVFIPSRSEALQWGRKTVTVKVLK